MTSIPRFSSWSVAAASLNPRTSGTVGSVGCTVSSPVDTTRRTSVASVPPEGSCEITRPSATVDDGSRLDTETMMPSASRRSVASASVRPTTSATTGVSSPSSSAPSGPLDTTRSTGPPSLPLSGVWSVTVPSSAVVDGSRVISPTSMPAASSSSTASVSVSPTRLGDLAVGQFLGGDVGVGRCAVVRLGRPPGEHRPATEQHHEQQGPEQAEPPPRLLR